MNTPRNSNLPPVETTFCILAGGLSRRMGCNKALLPFLGQPLIQRILERIRPVTGEIFIISDDQTSYNFLGLPVIPDQIPGRGVLGGLFTSLSVSSLPYVAPVPCDMPFINPALLIFEMGLIQSSDADVVIPQSFNGLEPLHAVYRRDTCLPFVQEALFQNKQRLISWFDQVNIQIISPDEVATYDPDGTTFLNINTPEDLARAELIGIKEL